MSRLVVKYSSTTKLGESESVHTSAHVARRHTLIVISRVMYTDWRLEKKLDRWSVCESKTAKCQGVKNGLSYKVSFKA